MDFLKTLLIVLLVFFALRFTWKLAKPYLFRYIAKKMGQRFEKSFGANPFGENPFKQHGETEKEGKVTIDRNPRNNPKNSKTVGEYVDYEEVE
ncbi:DUF4834 family protein [Marinirhabdus gelatinilytica]|uniref:Uncharacterized protein DUF4834 n=1 Tax=Marinirhabdus gelatinilytica TaxID=1703343 RepID=A0A370QAN0_9FLAO|nr:DUF4834 family protein [Marinirhabdus gelatinilytica]RDK85417.1 uncharacterized protein DUF4834 [Marinirhabdus gelatinilytica]